jgi:hypothetical protein
MNPQAEPSTQEVLAGLVERVTYHNAENGFCVLRAKARGHREMVTVVGHAAAPIVVELAHPRPGERVVDIACGTGLVARIAAARVGHWAFGEISLRSTVDGKTIRMVIDKANAKSESAGARQGSIFFEGTSDSDGVKGNLYYYAQGCQPIPYEIVSATFVSGKALILAAKPPRDVSGCKIVNYYKDTAHIINLDR